MERISRSKEQKGDPIVIKKLQQEFQETCGKETTNMDESSSLSPSSALPPFKKKGILWQQTNAWFNIWQERFFILTESSLHSFERPKLAKAMNPNGMFTVNIFVKSGKSKRTNFCFS